MVNVNTVTLMIWAGKIPFSVHVDLLYKEFSLSRAAFQCNFKARLEKTVFLPEDDVIAVRLSI